jgi:rubrerythrin
MSTLDDLKAAFAGESQASRKYMAFAGKADGEGLKQVARLFRAAAEAETVHARNHLEVMGGLKTTRDNLMAARDGEKYEFTEMYPVFIERAVAEKNVAAQTSFNFADAVEKVHHGLYVKALDSVAAGKPSGDFSYYVCQRCGNTVERNAPDKCPICGAAKKLFKKVE